MMTCQTGHEDHTELGLARKGWLALLAWALAGQGVIWLICAAGALGFLYTGENHWYVLARTRFLPVVLHLQLAMLPRYIVLAVILAGWLGLIRTAWIRYRPPRRRSAVRAGMVGLWVWFHVTVMAYAVVFHFGSFWTITNLLADKYGVVIRGRDLAGLAWPIRISALLLGAITVAAALRLVIDGWGRPVVRRAMAATLVVAIVVAAVMAWPSGQSAAARAMVARRPADRPNVIILAADSLRADHLGCYGYKDQTGRDTSPNIDRLARDGVVVEQLLSATGSTTDSWLSMLSGRWPHEHGIRCVFPTRAMAEAAGRVPTVVRTAREHGYRTVVLGDWAACSFDSIDHGFEVVGVDRDMTFPDYIGQVTEKSHVWITAAMMNPIAKALGLGCSAELSRNTYQDILGMIDRELDLAGETGQPLFLVAFFSTPHMPYRVYDEFDVRFGDPDYAGPHERAMNLSLHELLKGGANERVAAGRQRIIDLYDTTVWVFDHIVGRAVDQVRSRGILANSILVVTSDHGEDFYDPNTDSSHGKYLAAGLQSFQLPMIVHWPGGLTPRRVPDRLRGIDVGPTLLDLMGLPALPGASGASFLEALTGTSAVAVEERICFFETGFLWDCPATHPPGGEHLGYPIMSRVVLPDPAWDYRMTIPDSMYPTVMQAKDRAVLAGDWKLVYLATRGTPTLKLFNIKNDPHCLKPLSFDQGPFDRLASLLHGWITADPREAFYLYDGSTRAEFDRLFQQ